MLSIPNQLAPLIGTVPEWVILLSLLGLSLILVFAGRAIVKVIAFLIVGLAGASIGGMLGAQYLASMGASGALLGILLGFVLGGLLGVVSVAVGIGLAIGYAAYLLALDFAASTTIAIAVGVALFIVGVAISGKVLGVVTAVAGGLLFFDVLRVYGLGLPLATIFAAAITFAGIWVQDAPRRATQSTATNVGGQQGDHR